MTELLLLLTRHHISPSSPWEEQLQIQPYQPKQRQNNFFKPIGISKILVIKNQVIKSAVQLFRCRKFCRQMGFAKSGYAEVRIMQNEIFFNRHEY